MFEKSQAKFQILFCVRDYLRKIAQTGGRLWQD